MSTSKFTLHSTKPYLPRLGALLALVVGVYATVSWLNIGEWLNPERVADWLHTAGPLGPLLFMALMALSVVISPIPSLPLDLAAGATFGAMLATTYAVIGAEIGAILSFLIGRALGRELLTRIFRINVTFCEHCSDHHLALFVLLARLVPLFSFDLVSYGAGVTNMSLRAFAVATFIGMIPPTFAFTYAGSQVASGTWLMMTFGLAMVVMMLALPKLVLRYPDARWVRLLRGGLPVLAQVTSSSHKSAGPASNSTPRCDSCGAPLK